MKYLLFIIIIFFATKGRTQNSDISIKGGIQGIVSNNEEVPFWLRANSGFEISEFTNFVARIDANYTYKFSNSTLDAGAYIYGRDGVEKNVQRRDLYLKWSKKLFKITLGSKQSEEVALGLSSTNQNYLLSNNARPMPGLIIEANEPLKLFKIFDVDWGIAHYQLNDERFVVDTRVHYKRLNVKTKISDKSFITAGIQHFAQWAGNSPNNGDLRDDASAFWNVFIANRATELGLEGEIQNAVGNHLGTYLLRYDVELNKNNLALYHEHPFEDGSGTRLQNFPDGVWGISLMSKENSFFKGIVYEYIDTRSQSGNTSDSGFDGYFRNGIYRSGWTYEENIIGIPFYKTDKSINVTELTSQFVGSRFQVHHLAVAGVFKNFNWKVKMSYSKNFGLYRKPFIPIQEDFYSSGELFYTHNNKHDFKVVAGLDFLSSNITILAAGISYAYKFK